MTMASNSNMAGKGQKATLNNNSHPRFVIRPPTTGGDDGTPSESLLRDVRRILALIQDERHLCAYSLYQSVQQRLKDYTTKRGGDNYASTHRPTSSSSSTTTQTASQRNSRGVNPFRRKNGTESLEALASSEHEHNAARDLIRAKAAELDKLENRSRLFLKAKSNAGGNGEWILSQTLFGITTYYRREPDNSLSIKLEGELKDVPVFEQICVLKEFDLHCKWAPFCSSSLTIEELDKLDMVGWVVLGLPHLGLARDACFRAVGCDCMAEDGSFVLFGQGVRDRKPGDPPPEDSYLSEDPVLDELEFPDPPTSMGSGRMTIRKFEAIVHILSPTHVTTSLVANVNPNMNFIPQSLLDFLMRKLCGVILLKLQGAAKKIIKNPVRNPHARRIRESPEFYQNWLVPKIQHYCETKGWDMPKVSALEVMENHLEQELTPLRLANGNTTAALIQMHSTSEMDEELQNARHGGSLLRAQSDPVLEFSHSRDDSDAMSGLSTAMSSDTTKSNNPITAYLREAEAKAQRKKDEKIAEARHRANARLKPTEFSTDQNARLEELKQAKARREVVVSESNRPSFRPMGTHSTLTRSQQAAETLHVNTRNQNTRLMTISALVATLFVMLYSHVVMDFSSFFHSVDSTWLVLGENITTVAYMSFCAVVHLYLCEVVLVYVFDSLELGTKTGYEAKKYYSDNIRTAVLALSAGIVAISITRALMAISIRGAVWGLLQLSRWIQPQLMNVWNGIVIQVTGAIPSTVQSWGTTGWTVVLTFVQLVLNSVRVPLAFVLGFLYEVVIASNVIGSTCELLVMSVVKVVTSSVRSGESFFSDIIKGVEGDLELPSWRTISLDTSRALFSYTAVFLLASITFFKILVATRQTTSPKNEKKSSPKALRSASPPSLNGSLPLTGTTSPREKAVMRSNSARYATIKEEDESDVIVQSSSVASSLRGVSTPLSPTVSFQEGDTSAERMERAAASSSTPKRRRLFPRFRRKNRSSVDEETSPSSMVKNRERRRFRQSVTA